MARSSRPPRARRGLAPGVEARGAFRRSCRSCRPRMLQHPRGALARRAAVYPVGGQRVARAAFRRDPAARARGGPHSGPPPEVGLQDAVMPVAAAGAGEAAGEVGPPDDAPLPAVALALPERARLIGEGRAELTPGDLAQYTESSEPPRDEVDGLHAASLTPLPRVRAARGSSAKTVCSEASGGRPCTRWAKVSHLRSQAILARSSAAVRGPTVDPDRAAVEIDRFADGATAPVATPGCDGRGDRSGGSGLSGPSTLAGLSYSRSFRPARR